MAAFEAAVALGVECVEVDVAMSLDGELVVLHTRELKGLMGKEWQEGMQVGDIPWGDLSKRRWPGGQRPLKAEEAIEYLGARMRTVVLDVKPYYARGKRVSDWVALSDNLVLLAQELGCTNCMIWGKDDQVISSVASRWPRTGYVLMNHTEEAIAGGLDQPLRLKEPSVVGAAHGVIDALLVRLLHTNGKQCWAWTVDDVRVMRSVLDAGVDAIVTNEPELAQEAVDWRVSICEE